MDLNQKKCVPCEGGLPPFGATETQNYLAHLESGWAVVENLKLRKEYQFKDFKEAMIFVDRVAVLAESEGHHPNIHIAYNRVILEIWTHAINGLSENDFILAAKADAL